MLYRNNCLTCFLAKTNCICAQIKPCKSNLDVVILQHFRETKKAIGTAKIVTLSIQNSKILLGPKLNENPKYRELIEEPGQFFLLYPDETSVPIESVTLDPSIKNTLLAIDGTRPHALHILKETTLPKNLIKLKITPKFISNYLIRTQPNNLCLSTVESIVYTLEKLENADGKYQHMLDVFHSMVNKQAQYIPEDHLKNRKKFKKEINDF